MSKHTGNSTCPHLGHEWHTITVNYRLCTREHCHASERLMDGVWVSNAPFYRKHRPVVPTTGHPRQTALWEGEHERKETPRS